MNLIKLIEWFAEQTGSSPKWALEICLPTQRIVEFRLRKSIDDLDDDPCCYQTIRFDLKEVALQREDFVRIELEKAIRKLNVMTHHGS